MEGAEVGGEFELVGGGAVEVEVERGALSDTIGDGTGVCTGVASRDGGGERSEDEEDDGEQVMGAGEAAGAVCVVGGVTVEDEVDNGEVALGFLEDLGCLNVSVLETFPAEG